MTPSPHTRLVSISCCGHFEAATEVSILCQSASNRVCPLILGLSVGPSSCCHATREAASPRCLSHPETPCVLLVRWAAVHLGMTSDPICRDPVIPHPGSLDSVTLYTSNRDPAHHDPPSRNTGKLHHRETPDPATSDPDQHQRRTGLQAVKPGVGVGV